MVAWWTPRATGGEPVLAAEPRSWCGSSKWTASTRKCRACSRVTPPSQGGGTGSNPVGGTPDGTPKIRRKRLESRGFVASRHKMRVRLRAAALCSRPACGVQFVSKLCPDHRPLPDNLSTTSVPLVMRLAKAAMTAANMAGPAVRSRRTRESPRGFRETWDPLHSGVPGSALGGTRTHHLLIRSGT